jgi:hypothetical protein
MQVFAEVEFSRVNLIQEALLQARIFKHLAISDGLVIVADALNRRVGRYKRRVDDLSFRPWFTL